MKCAHCGTMLGHGIYIRDGEMFCSQDCAEKYNEDQTELSDSC